MKRGTGGFVFTAFVGLGLGAPAVADVPVVHAAGLAPAHAAGASSLPDDLKIAFICVGLAALLVGSLVLAVAMNFRKSLAADTGDAWEDPHYRRALPNVLARLRSRGFATAWPRYCNPWSMHRFERRLLRIVRPMLRHRAKAFVEQHLSAWIWVESHRAACRTLLRVRQVERALEFLSIQDMPHQRAGVLAFLGSRASQEIPAAFDKATARRLRLVQSLQIVMREHGYTMAPELAERDLLERVSREDLVEVLLPRRHGRWAAAAVHSRLGAS